MNRIDELFHRKKQRILSVYFTAGYPQLTDTGMIISGLERAGADLLEIGFPFSDPVADGPVIQASSHHALTNGMNLGILFEQLREISKTSSIPKILMGYYNTVYQFQTERFVHECKDSGVDGVIIPDLPPEIYEKLYRELFEAAGIYFICLVSPQTTTERAVYLSSLSRGFIYRLSSSSTTGSDVQGSLSALPDPAIQMRNISIPSLIGFGIHDHETFEKACNHANGAIIGTAFIRHLNSLRIAKNQGLPVTDERQVLINDICKSFVDEILFGTR